MGFCAGLPVGGFRRILDGGAQMGGRPVIHYDLYQSTRNVIMAFNDALCRRYREIAAVLRAAKPLAEADGGKATPEQSLMTIGGGRPCAEMCVI